MMMFLVRCLSAYGILLVVTGGYLTWLWLCPPPDEPE